MMSLGDNLYFLIFVNLSRADSLKCGFHSPFFERAPVIYVTSRIIEFHALLVGKKCSKLNMKVFNFLGQYKFRTLVMNGNPALKGLCSEKYAYWFKLIHSQFYISEVKLRQPTTLFNRSGNIILVKTYLLKWLGCSLGHRLGRKL